jgi:hypothetical protein
MDLVSLIWADQSTPMANAWIAAGRIKVQVLMFDAVECCIMRTTLTIDDDVLDAAKAIADRKNRTVGEVLSQLARAALRPSAAHGVRNGIPLLPPGDGGKVVTPAIQACGDTVIVVTRGAANSVFGNSSR